jgi:hypothetical protein
MKDDLPERWMWSEACEMLARAEQLQSILTRSHRIRKRNQTTSSCRISRSKSRRPLRRLQCLPLGHQVRSLKERHEAGRRRQLDPKAAVVVHALLGGVR